MFCFSTIFRKKISCQVIEEIDDEYYAKDLHKFMEKFYISPYSKKSDFVLFSGNSNKELAQEISMTLKAPLGKVSIMKEFNGESFIKFHENVNNKNVILIQSMSNPVNENLIELLFLISALKRESAKNIIVVIPFFAYLRGTSEMPYSSQLIVRMLEGLGADQVIAMDLHNKHITGYSKSMPIIDLDMVYIGVSYFMDKIEREEISKKIVVVSPDCNGVTRARKFKDILDLNGIDVTFGFIADFMEGSQE